MGSSVALLVLILVGFWSPRPAVPRVAVAFKPLSVHVARRHQAPKIATPNQRSGATLANATLLPTFAPLVPLTDCAQVNCIALTFDDGPNPRTTPQIVETLEQYHATASFFMVGSRVAGNGPLLRRMQADGYEIGNHSWSHPDLTKLSDDQIRAEVQQTQKVIADQDVPMPNLFRPPYGAIDPRTDHDINMPILMWNEDPRDWDAKNSQQVVQSVEAAAQPGGIIDMHDIYHLTADALPQILTDLQNQGYHFVTVSQLLNLPPNSHGIYYGLNRHP